MASKKLNNKLHQMINFRRAGLDRHSGLNYVLWDLFCNIISALNMNVYTWNSLMVNYVKKQERHFQNRRDTASIRGNLNKEFTRGNMTWKVFCKGLMFLQVVKFKISIDLTFATGRTTHHEQVVTFNSVDPFLNSEEDAAGAVTDQDVVSPAAAPAHPTLPLLTHDTTPKVDFSQLARTREPVPIKVVQLDEEADKDNTPW